MLKSAVALKADVTEKIDIPLEKVIWARQTAFERKQYQGSRADDMGRKMDKDKV